MEIDIYGMLAIKSQHTQEIHHEIFRHNPILDVANRHQRTD
ncbi:MAG: hypothetical protein ACI80L_000823 [Pseudohongiellaceae bacterium]|jgi:hypothetical protein